MGKQNIVSTGSYNLGKSVKILYINKDLFRILHSKIIPKQDLILYSQESNIKKYYCRLYFYRSTLIFMTQAQSRAAMGKSKIFINQG